MLQDSPLSYSIWIYCLNEETEAQTRIESREQHALSVPRQGVAPSAEPEATLKTLKCLINQGMLLPKVCGF